MIRTSVNTLGLAAALAVAASTAHAQQVPATSTPAPQVGEIAPDFTMPGATRFGMLDKPIRLSDFRGKTVVLAFFIRARTKG